VGTRFIEYNPREGVYLDNRGNIVPDRMLQAPEVRVRRFVGHDIQGRPFISTTFTDRRVSREVAVQHTYAGNQELVVRTVYRTPSGRVYTLYTSSALGRAPNVSDLENIAFRRATGATGYPGPGVEAASAENEILSHEYLIRSVNVGARGG